MLWDCSLFSQKEEQPGPSERESLLEPSTQEVTLKDLRRSLCPGGPRRLRYWKMRTRRELEPKGPKPASPSALGANSNISQQPATVTFSPVDIHVEAR
ncbi:NCMAP [Cervus elaphus hippelaphus]|uniref:NCMAP n=1 Tax=Cervus elaphus hippelaphus TaxID=46360 RepID=A0A212D3U4_CEREH|nr:NCMAP [Cervus elaphus hippelaphus]